MRRKLWRMFLISSLLISITVVLVGRGTGVASQEPVVSVDPQEIKDIPVNGTFTVDIIVTNVTDPKDLYAFSINMTFNPNVLNCTSVEEGPFLKEVWETMWQEVTIRPGWVSFADALMPGAQSGATGSGTLANVTFEVLAVGSTPLNFSKTTLIHMEGGLPYGILHIVVPGFFTNLHDVAVVDVKPSATSVMLGESVYIDVTVANEGDFPETFSVTTHWNIGALHGVIGTNITSLEGRKSTPLRFKWPTTGICTGAYTISAEASVIPGENDTSDNTFIDGEVTVNVTGQPQAKFTYSPTKPKLGESITFTSTSTDPDGWIVSWDWTFDDGSIESGEVVTHAYAQVGTYKVTLNVTDNDGLCNIVWTPVKVLSYPVAIFNYSPEEPLRNRTVTFDASGSTPDGGTIDSYAWDFGDGTTETYLRDVNLTAIAYHAYEHEGTYTVNLTVTDSEGLTDSATRNVPVSIKHDVAVLSVSIPREYKPVYAGFWTKVDVDVKNEGTETETFNVTVYLEDTPIETREVADLAPLETRSLKPRPILNTTSLSAGEYTITAEAILDGDENSTNNKKATIMNVNVADAAITNVTASPRTVLAGDLLNVSVTVKNEGTVTPTVALNVYIYLANASHSNILIDNFNVIGLANGTEKTVSRSWNATKAGISPGTYTLSAEVSPIMVGAVTVESDFADNVFPRGDIPSINVTVGASLISISANPEAITLGSSTTINGSITPGRSGVNVTLQYRLSGEDAWSTIKTVTTDENSTYSYDWTPEKVGTYDVMASWEGDDNTLPSESEIQILKVEETPPTIIYFLYAMAAVAIIIVGAIAIYFLKLRKTKPT